MAFSYMPAAMYYSLRHDDSFLSPSFTVSFWHVVCALWSGLKHGSAGSRPQCPLYKFTYLHVLTCGKLYGWFRFGSQ